MKKPESFLTSFIILTTLILCIKKALISFSDVYAIHLFVISMMVLFHLVPIKLCSEFIFKEALKENKKIPQMFLCSIYVLALVISMPLLDSHVALDQDLTEYQKSVLRYFAFCMSNASYLIIFVNAYFKTTGFELYPGPAKK